MKLSFRNFRVRVAGALVVFLVATLTAACSGGGGDSGGDGPSGASGDPVRGGTLTYISSTEPQSLDPATMNMSGATQGVFALMLYGALVRNDPETGDPEMVMAESLDSEDGTDWTLKLRDGLVFSDGSPLTAESVKFIWERLKDPEVAAPINAGTAEAVASMTVVDDLTLEFTLTRPSAQFDQDIATTALNFIAQPEALEAGPEAFNAAPVGAGPFILDSWRRQDRMVLKRNPEYYDEERPYVDELIIRADPDATRRLTAVQSGEADIVIASNPSQMEDAAAAGTVVTEVATNGTSLILFNMAKPPFDDQRAREAVSLALDVDILNEVGYGGANAKATTLFGEKSPFYNPDLTYPEPDPERAQELFNEIAADGDPVSFSLLGTGGVAEASRIQQSIQAQLAEFDNVEVSIDALESTAYLAKLGTRDFQTSTYGTIVVDPEPGISRLLESGRPSNFMGLSDEAMDKALEIGRTSFDEAERKAAYDTVMERILELKPYIATGRPLLATFSTPQVGGITFYGQGVPNLDGVWLDENAG